MIVVNTAPGREHWLADTLKSIGDRESLVVSQWGWELGGIRWVYENTTIDRFLFMQDTIVVKDPGFFDLAFDASPGSVSVCDCPNRYGLYFGVFTRDSLAQVELPQVRDKEHAIELEAAWAKQYDAIEPDAPLLFTDFRDSTAKRTEVRYGRVNLRLENDYLIKWKGTWR